MSLLARSVRSYYVRNRAQLVLAIIGMALGVAVVIAVDLANQSATLAYQRSVSIIDGPVTHQIVGGPSGIDEQVLKQINLQAPALAVTPVVTANVAVQKTGLSLIGIDPITESNLRQDGFVNQSLTQPAGPDNGPDLVTFLTEPGAAIITEANARRFGLIPGQRFQVRANGRMHSAILSGVIDAEETLNTVMWVDIATAQEWLDTSGRVSRIDLAITDESQLSLLEQVLPADTQILNAASRSDTNLQLSKAFMTNLTAMSFLALLVGVFLVFNSMSFAVMQRRADFATLRALGATRGELLRLIIVESQLIALTGAVIGAVIGYFLAGFLLKLVAGSINDLYYRIEVTKVEFLPTLFLRTTIIAMLVAGIAAWLPARAAATSAPRVAQLRSNAEARFRRHLPRMAIVGVILLAGSLLGLKASGASLVIGLIILFIMILAIGLILPWLLALLIDVAARHAGGFPTWIQLALATLRESISRSTVAVVALAIAISATVGVTTMVGSFRAAVIDWLDVSLAADVYVAIPGGEISPQLRSAIVEVTPDAAVTALRRTSIDTKDGKLRLESISLDGRAFDQFLLIETLSGLGTRQRFLAGEGVLITESYAYHQNIALGDSVTLGNTRQDVSLPVVGIYRSYDVRASHIVMTEPRYRQLFDDQGVDGLGLSLPSGADLSVVVAKIQAISARSNADLIVVRNDKIREQTLIVFDRTFVITNVLYWLAVIVAAVGVFGALMALQLENRQQYALLRTLGITPMGIRGIVLLQALLMGFMSALFALPIGLMMADILIEIINRRAFGWGMATVWFPSVVWQALLLGLGAALLASLIPAQRVAQSWPGHAVRSAS